ncbi:hypothetical protein KQX54_000578 [Cotesia glomerata]|uniref:Peptidase A2 domain-containing protein n=1 Tax=Cotesia glomerata TaxID=32391 RepID=A0AAV7IVI7_COTGL|nr:hypothetical protein KQX54_000578 [Cotesia glomerata]
MMNSALRHLLLELENTKAPVPIDIELVGPDEELEKAFVESEGPEICVLDAVEDEEVVILDDEVEEDGLDSGFEPDFVGFGKILEAPRKESSGTEPKPPLVTARIPVSIWVFGIQLNEILDTGSERSYINSQVYEKVQDLSSGNLRSDDTERRGVLLANGELCKSKGGAPFIIQVGSIAGEQYLSVLEGLSHSVVLGMDFALAFGVKIDCGSRTWSIDSSLERHPFTIVHCSESRRVLCSVLTLDQ